MFIARCDTSAGGMCGDGPHIAGRPVNLLLGPDPRERVPLPAPAGVAVSSRSLTTKGASPCGWIELLNQAAEASRITQHPRMPQHRTSG